MSTFFNLPLNKIVESRPVDLTVSERGYQGCDGASKHTNSLFSDRFKTGVNLSLRGRLGKKTMKSFLILMAFSSLAVPAAVVNAKEEPVVRLQSSDARRISVSAVRDIMNDRWSEGRRKLQESRDPLAAKLYLWFLFTKKENKDWDPANFIKLTQFVRHNSDWPGISKLQVLVEGVMPYSMSNAEVLAWYNDYPPQTPLGMERYMDALIIEGQKDKAREFLANWWAETLTSRDQQRKIFQKFGQYLTLDAHKRRFDSLLSNGYYDNARAMAGVLGQGYPELAEARIALAENKGGVEGAVSRVPSYLQNDPGLLFERLRWRRKNDLNSGAIEILERQPAAEKIRNKEDWWKERHIIIRRLLEEKKYKQAYKLASNHYQTDGLPYAEAQWLAGWLALRYMDKPTQAYEYFTAIYPKVNTPVSKSRAAYWAGRAATSMKKKDMAQDWYRKAAQFRTVFYGQLAASELMIEGDLSEQDVPSLTAKDRDGYARNDLVQVSRLLYEAGEKDMSARFLHAFSDSQGKPQAYRYAAEMAADMGDNYLAVNIAKKAVKEGWVMTKQSYPVINQWMSDISGVEMALVHSLIRQESIFDQNAESHAGAVGLMQLMPRTAKEVAGKIDVSFDQRWLKDRPEYNIRLGSAYMARLLSKYNGYYPLAIAAYNAGPGRVDGWLKTFGDPRNHEIDLLDWVEMVPVYETRNYVQRVMEGLYVYRLRLRNIQGQPETRLDVAIRENP